MKNLESKIYDVLKEAGVPVKQAKKNGKKDSSKSRVLYLGEETGRG